LFLNDPRARSPSLIRFPHARRWCAAAARSAANADDHIGDLRRRYLSGGIRALTSDGYRKAIAVIRETPINESDAAMRLARAEAIGYQKGLRISACMIAAPVGAIIGLALGLVAWVVGL
jgi:hypothetical protein